MLRAFLFLPLALALSCVNTARPDVTLDEEALKRADRFDYADWSYVVTTYVNAHGRVDYPALKQDRARLDRFVATLGKVGPETRPELFSTKEAKLAYYINAYNALTMFNVINRYPEIQTVTDKKINFFVLTKFELDGAEVNLYDLENKIIRPRFQDPRIHFALNCASAGCPVLPNEIFDPERLDEQLDRETAKFLHEKRNVAVEGGKIVLSEIFKWYAEDFAPDPVSWIRAYAPDLVLPEGTEVTHRPYDWALNDQTRAAATR